MYIYISKSWRTLTSPRNEKTIKQSALNYAGKCISHFRLQGHAIPTVEWSSGEVQHFVRNQMKELQIMLWATDLETQEVHLSDQIQQFLRQKCARKP